MTNENERFFGCTSTMSPTKGRQRNESDHHNRDQLARPLSLKQELVECVGEVVRRRRVRVEDRQVAELRKYLGRDVAPAQDDMTGHAKDDINVRDCCEPDPPRKLRRSKTKRNKAQPCSSLAAAAAVGRSKTKRNKAQPPPPPPAARAAGEAVGEEDRDVDDSHDENGDGRVLRSWGGSVWDHVNAMISPRMLEKGQDMMGQEGREGPETVLPKRSSWD